MPAGPKEARRSAGAAGDAVDASNFRRVGLAPGLCYVILRRSLWSAALREK